MKKIILLLAALCFLILLVLGFFFWKNQKVNQNDLLQDQEAGLPQEEQTTPYVDPFPDDLDRDGILDSEEAELGTSSEQYDTDGDGLTDYDEINVWQSDPTNPDSDGDGFSDGWEVLSGYSPTGTQPLSNS